MSTLERRITQKATQVVAIGEAFQRHYEQKWKLKRSGVSVVPNWAPLDDITPRPLDNPWSASWVVERGDITLVYAGTLGRKHNPPELLVDLIKSAQARGLMRASLSSPRAKELI